MKASSVRNWIGIYFLILTSVLGAYILLFGETRLLPISKSDATDTFQIIIPVLLAQVTTVFTWFTASHGPADHQPVNIPAWVVKAPPILVGVLLLAAIVATIISGNSSSQEVWVDSSRFKLLVTFCVSLLNATSALIVTRFFGRSTDQVATSAPSPQSSTGQV